MSIEEIKATGLYELKALVSQLQAVAKASFAYAWNGEGDSGTCEQLFCAVETLSNQAYDATDSLEEKLMNYRPHKEKETEQEATQ